MSVPGKLAPDDVFPAEIAQDLVDDANAARDVFLVAHRPRRPQPGRHVSVIEPIATFRYDLPADYNVPDAQGTARFHEGLVSAPKWGLGPSPIPGDGGVSRFWIEFTTALDAPIYGVQVGLGWNNSAQAVDLAAPLAHYQFNKGWIVWPRPIDAGTGKLILGATSVQHVAWVTVAVMGVSPWR